MAILNISREVCEDFDDKIKQFTREYTNRFKFVYKEGPLVLIGVLPKLRDLDGVDARLLAKYNSYFGVVQTFNDDVLLGDEQGPSLCQDDVLETPFDIVARHGPPDLYAKWNLMLVLVKFAFLATGRTESFEGDRQFLVDLQYVCTKVLNHYGKESPDDMSEDDTFTREAELYSLSRTTNELLKEELKQARAEAKSAEEEAAMWKTKYETLKTRMASVLSSD